MTIKPFDVNEIQQLVDRFITHLKKTYAGVDASILVSFPHDENRFGMFAFSSMSEDKFLYCMREAAKTILKQRGVDLEENVIDAFEKFKAENPDLFPVKDELN